MARDIEEFLRRAAERRKQAQQGGGQQRPPARPAPQQTPPRQLTERDVVQPRQESPARPLPSSQPTPLGQESVADHVNRYLDVSDIVEHVDQLGDDIEQADERMEAHLDDVFDHEVGKLSSSKNKSFTDDLRAQTHEGDQIAKGIFKLLQNPRTIRQSIMIAEILKRPDILDDE